MEDFWAAVLSGLRVWLYLILAFIMVPAMFGFSLGISEVYMNLLVKTLEWATRRLQKVEAEEQQQLKASSSGLIQRDDGSMEDEMGELRRSRPKPPVGGDFTLSDCFYFYRRGIEDIVEDEVTQRFTSEELVSWNLLTRTNNDFHYISLKLSLVWGLGVCIRYCVLAPLRCLIQRDDGSMEDEMGELRRSRPKPPVGGDFTLSDCFYFYRRGIEDIVEDEVTQRFTSEELVSWNLLTRTNNDFHYISLKLSLVWGLGVCIRYCVLAPLRITLASIGLTWLVIATSAVGVLPDWRLKFWLSEWAHIMCYRICARGLSATIHYHNRENKPKKGGICVANHTSPIDIVILCNDGCYAMVGQVHGGLMGVVQRAMVRSCPHVWFERAEMKDRTLVSKRLRDHVSDRTKLPILIFPEGTCINNTSVMMFKKGSFEIGGTIYPVAIKYDPQFGDAFWNSAKYNMVAYLLRMMTSWAIVCNVWYLPAMTQQEGEDAVQFANRVKSAIAHQGGLVDLSWDGGLKRAKVKDTFKEQQQKQYCNMVLGSEDSSSSD